MTPNVSDSSSLPGLWTPPTPEELQRLLPQFEIEGFIGQGGMGVVYRARQLLLNRTVAIKLLPPQNRRAELDFVERFKVEARTLARLAHPGIVAVHDFGEAAGGLLYFVMEHVEGEDLAKRLESSGPLPAGEALRIVLSVCDALEYAHGEGVVHRDIKPSNLLLGKDGRIKLADFGLAKIEDPLTKVPLTLSQTTMGSHDYAAPEVFARAATAATADHRADLYSLGVVLYQMLTGGVPRGLFKLPSEKVPGLDPRFDAIICRALEEDREERHASVAELRSDLEPLADPASGKVSRIAPRRGLRYSLVGLAVVGTLLGTGIWTVPDRPKPRQTDNRPPEMGDWQDLLARVDLERDVRDGYWRFVNGALANRYEIGRNAFVIPASPKGPCDLRFRLTREAPSIGVVVFAFRFGSHRGQFTISDYTKPHAGLGNINGKPSKENGFCVEWPTAFLTIGVEHEIVLRLREDGIAVDHDGEEFYRWQGDWSQVTLDEGWREDFDAGAGLALATTHGLVSVREVSLREITDAEDRLLPERTESGSLLPHPPPSRERPDSGHHYQFVPGAFTWEEAARAARSLGGHLVTHGSREEHEWVWRTFSPWLPAMATRNLTSRGWWIGATRSTEDPAWRWVTGEPFSFTGWAAVEPDTAGDAAAAQHHLGPDGGLSGWTPRPPSTRLGFVVEWDRTPSLNAGQPVTDAEARDFVAWMLRQPILLNQDDPDLKFPDFMIEGSPRNLRKFDELPEEPFQLTRIRLGRLEIDEEARTRLAVMGRMNRLYDLRFHAVEDAEAVLSLRNLSRLGTVVLSAAETGVTPLDDSLLAALADKPLLGILRLDGWSRLTGEGLAHLTAKTRLETLTLIDCPDLNDAGLAEIAKFTRLNSLSLPGSTKITDAGAVHLKQLKNLRTLGLERTNLSDAAVADLRSSLPDCTVLR